MEIIVIKRLDGSLVPATEEEADKLRQIKAGTGLKVKLTRVRNFKFLQKTMVLFNVCFDYFCEHGVSKQQYRGQDVVASKDRFRKDLTILAGFYKPTFDIRGNLRLEADSLSYASCSEEKANAIYQAVITAALNNVYKGSLTEKELQDWVDRLLHFAG